MTRHRLTRRGLMAPLFACALLCGCSSKPPAPSQPTASGASSSAPAQPAPARADCGPPVTEQSDNVRVAVLEDLIGRAEADALQHQVKLGPIVLAQEDRQPGNRSMIRDPGPELMERFAEKTPPVGTYSSAFMVQGTRAVQSGDAVVFSTGEICWTSPSRAIVDARRLTTSGNSPFRATVEQRDGSWQVTSLADRR